MIRIRLDHPAIKLSHQVVSRHRWYEDPALYVPWSAPRRTVRQLVWAQVSASSIRASRGR